MNVVFRRCIPVVVLMGLILVLAGGCSRKPTQAPENSETAENGQDSDPRWREKMLQNGLNVLLTLSDSMSAENCREQLGQCLARLDTWLQGEPTPKDWKVDAEAAGWLAVFDSLETAQQLLHDWIRNLQTPKPNSNPWDELAKLSAALQDSAGKITPEMPPLFQALKGFLTKFDSQIQPVLQAQKIEDKTFLQTALANEWVFDRLSPLYGSSRAKFTPSVALDFDEVQHPLHFAFTGDVSSLFEIFLMQDVSRWAQGKPSASPHSTDLNTAGFHDTSGEPNDVEVSAEDIQRARAIFDWTVMNIALTRENFVDTLQSSVIPQTPGEVLLSGCGSALERAWLCVLLGRQQGLDFVLVRIPTAPAEGTLDADLGDGSRTLLGYVQTDDLALFDPQLGISLEMTWKELLNAPEKYSEMLAKAGVTRTVSAENLQQAQFQMEAAPVYLSLRMRILQTRLTGQNRVVLTADPTALRQRLEKQGLAPEAISLWAYPCEVTLWRALNLEPSYKQELQINAPFMQRIDGELPYWHARMLHLKGVLTGRLSATFFYQKARPSDMALEKLAKSDEHPSEQELLFIRHIRLLASYFMGNISYSVGNTAAAMEYYQVHVLPIKEGNPWLSDANFHCARLEEQSGNAEKAAEFYRAVTDLEKPQAEIRLAK